VWRYVLHYPFPLDEEAMQRAASRFIGAHDFTSFAASTGSEDDDKERNMVREIYSAEVRRADGEELHFKVHGQSFLRYMVRKMMGALLEVGRGRKTPDDMDRLYELKDRSKSGPTAPPEGLCMVRVEHEEGWRIDP
jgi:tRNA pseudouridine38-40 synthase